MREPISWFESRFWFKRNGWIHKEGARLHENIEDGEVCIFLKIMPCDMAHVLHIIFMYLSRI